VPDFHRIQLIRIEVESNGSLHMRVFVAMLLCVVPQSTESFTHQVDLQAMIRDNQALQKLRIMYDLPTEHGFHLLFVSGDGTLVLQAYPRRMMDTSDVPTCKERIGPDKVKEILGLMIERRFWELPEKQFIFFGDWPKPSELELHRIFISNGVEKAGRTFAIGTYGGKPESIPADFAIIERQFMNLEQGAFPGKPCHLAPAIKF
jgi:hypothetical protein